MKNKGFTLIEVMIVVAIVGTLAAIAIPNLSNHLREAKRTDAIVALNALQQAQAKLRANCRWYGEARGTNGCAATPAASEVNYPATTESNFYNIAITPDTASGNAYTATATAPTTSPQYSDVACRVFTLTVNATNPNGLKTPADCWQ